MVLIRGRIRRVGNSLAFIIPASEARRAKLVPGQEVDAEIQVFPRSPLGLLRGVVGYREYRRHEEPIERE